VAQRGLRYRGSCRPRRGTRRGCGPLACLREPRAGGHRPPDLRRLRGALGDHGFDVPGSPAHRTLPLSGVRSQPPDTPLALPAAGGPALPALPVPAANPVVAGAAGGHGLVRRHLPATALGVAPHRACPDLAEHQLGGHRRQQRDVGRGGRCRRRPPRLARRSRSPEAVLCALCPRRSSDPAAIVRRRRPRPGGGVVGVPWGVAPLRLRDVECGRRAPLFDRRPAARRPATAGLARSLDDIRREARAAG
jgi:hypothetical protein